MRRSAPLALLVTTLVACAAGERHAADSARSVAAPADTATSLPAARAETTAVAPARTSAPGGRAAPVENGARVTGGPQRTRPVPRSSGCGGSYVNVTVKATALEGTTLDAVARDVLAPVRGEVGAPALSPAIRAFRVQVRDTATVERVAARLRASPRVASAERDGCAVRIDREP